MVNALCFAAHDQVSKQFTDKHSITTNFFAGAAAGACQAFVVSPMVREKHLKLKFNKFKIGTA